MQEQALTLHRVSKSYGRHRALIDVSVAFAPGEVSVVLGPNGAGKSTLLGIATTLVRPTSGVVSWRGVRLDGGTALRRFIGYVGHDPGLYGDLTARQNLALFATLYGQPPHAARIEALLARVGLGEVSRDATVRTFSRGMQQRLALARALLGEPHILLFDEPSAALDPAGAAWLTMELRRESQAGRVVVLVTHDLEAAAAVAQRLVILRRGRVACDEGRRDGFPPADMRRLYEERTRA